MPSQESITDAKERFIVAVMEGISVLMARCGYSRERATSALLRELSRGEFEFIRPTDDEVSDTFLVILDAILDDYPKETTPIDRETSPKDDHTTAMVVRARFIPRRRCNRERNDWSHSAGLTVRDRRYGSCGIGSVDGSCECFRRLTDSQLVLAYITVTN